MSAPDRIAVDMVRLAIHPRACRLLAERWASVPEDQIAGVVLALLAMDPCRLSAELHTPTG